MYNLQIQQIDIKSKLRHLHLQSYILKDTKDQHFVVLTQKICVKYVCFQCDFKEVYNARML